MYSLYFFLIPCIQNSLYDLLLRCFKDTIIAVQGEFNCWIGRFIGSILHCLERLIGLLDGLNLPFKGCTAVHFTSFCSTSGNAVSPLLRFPV